jgi:hypothetical protein
MSEEEQHPHEEEEEQYQQPTEEQRREERLKQLQDNFAASRKVILEQDKQLLHEEEPAKKPSPRRFDPVKEFGAPHRNNYFKYAKIMQEKIKGTTQKLLLPSDPMHSGITLDDYCRSPYTAEPMDRDMAICFHHFFLTNCVVAITQSKEYMVRIENNGQANWEPKSKTELEAILKKRSHRVVRPKGGTDMINYSRYLEYPEINSNMLSFTGVDFMKSPSNPNCFGVWTGYAVNPVGLPDENLIQPFLDHVLNVICDGNRELYDIEMKKNAWMFQNPNEHMQWATVLIGEQGTGKNFYTDVLCSLWGSLWSNPNVKISQVTDDKASTIVKYRKLIVCNELPKWSNSNPNRKEWETLKSRITDETLKVRAMYQDYGDYQLRNVSNYIFCTNNVDALPLSQDDRRFFILKVKTLFDPMTQQDEKKKYFNDLGNLVKTETFKTHLLTYLIQLPTQGLNRWQPPMTAMKREMTEAHEPFPFRYIKLQRWRTRDGGELRDHVEWIEFSWVWNDYLIWLTDVVGADGAKYAGAVNRFTAPLILAGLIEKKGKPVWIRPAKKLIDLWTSEPRDDNELLVEKNGYAMAALKRKVQRQQEETKKMCEEKAARKKHQKELEMDMIAHEYDPMEEEESDKKEDKEIE